MMNNEFKSSYNIEKSLGQLLKLLPQCAVKIILTWFKEQNKKESYTPGISNCNSYFW